jgi:hypothetical protein
MKIGSLTKVALVVTLMMGQVTPPASNSDYYEDDGDFNVVSSALSGGWGWGLNKAHASCDTNESTEPCVDVIVEPLPDEPWQHDSGDGNTGGGDGDEGGGAGSSDGDDTPEPEPMSAEEKEAR